MTAAVAAMGAVWLSLTATVGARLVLEPDIHRYVGGVSVAPGLLSTLVGSSGYLTFAGLHAAAVGGVVYLVVRARPPRLVVLGALPVLWWMLPLGADVVAGLLLVGVVLHHEKDRARAWGLYTLGALYHLAALGAGGLLVLPRSRVARWVVGGGLLLVAVVVLRTSYYGNALTLDARSVAHGVCVAGFVVLLGLLPYVAGHLELDRGVWLLAAGTGLVALYASHGELHAGASFERVLFAGTRYALPLVLCALILGRGVGWAKRTPKSGAPWGETNNA